MYPPLIQCSLMLLWLHTIKIQMHEFRNTNTEKSAPPKPIRELNEHLISYSKHKPSQSRSHMTGGGWWWPNRRWRIHQLNHRAGRPEWQWPGRTGGRRTPPDAWNHTLVYLAHSSKWGHTTHLIYNNYYKRTQSPKHTAFLESTITD